MQQESLQLPHLFRVREAVISRREFNSRDLGCALVSRGLVESEKLMTKRRCRAQLHGPSWKLRKIRKLWN